MKGDPNIGSMRGEEGHGEPSVVTLCGTVAGVCRFLKS